MDFHRSWGRLFYRVGQDALPAETLKSGGEGVESIDRNLFEGKMFLQNLGEHHTQWQPLFEVPVTKYSHYREVPRWEIFMEQELRFELDFGRLALLKKRSGPIMSNFLGLFFHFFGFNFFLNFFFENTIASALKSCIIPLSQKKCFFNFLNPKKVKNPFFFRAKIWVEFECNYIKVGNRLLLAIVLFEGVYSRHDTYYDLIHKITDGFVVWHHFL